MGTKCMRNKRVFPALAVILAWSVVAGPPVSAQDARTRADEKRIAQVMSQAQRLRPQLRREIRARERRYGPSDRVAEQDRQALRRIDEGLAFYGKPSRGSGRRHHAAHPPA